MYNGIGLATSRGTGTNGYVQKNLSYVRVHKEKVEYKPDEESKKLEAYINRKGNVELLKHDRKRKIELKCVEMEDLMREQGYKEEEIEKKVEKFRKQLQEKDSQKNQDEVEISYDQNGKPIGTETHKQAEANDMKNRKLREAFGLGEFDPVVRAKQNEEELRAREEREKELRRKKYQWVDEDDLKDEDDDFDDAPIIARRLASQVIEVKKKVVDVVKLESDEKKKSPKKEKKLKKKRRHSSTSSSSSSSSVVGLLVAVDHHLNQVRVITKRKNLVKK